jgi:hypothetical protein
MFRLADCEKGRSTLRLFSLGRLFFLRRSIRLMQQIDHVLVQAIAHPEPL